MTKQRRTFSAEFKREAADLVLKQNYSFIEASRSLSVGESALRRWVDQLQQERTGVTPQSKAAPFRVLADARIPVDDFELMLPARPSSQPAQDQKGAP